MLNENENQRFNKMRFTSIAMKSYESGFQRNRNYSSQRKYKPKWETCQKKCYVDLLKISLEWSEGSC